jgi:hypothetical protein
MACSIRLLEEGVRTGGLRACSPDFGSKVGGLKLAILTDVGLSQGSIRQLLFVAIQSTGERSNEREKSIRSAMLLLGPRAQSKWRE